MVGYIVDSIYVALSFVSNWISCIAGDDQLNEVAEAIQPVEVKSYTPQDQPHALLYEQNHQGVGGSGIAYGR